MLHLVRKLIIRDIMNGPGHPLLIRPPRTRLLVRLLRHWVGLFFVVLLSFGFLIMISMPLLVFLSFSYYLLSRDWRGHGYSLALLHLLTSAVWIGSVLGAGPLRSLIGANLM
ncbi:hypothetical protein [Paenibacillus sp. GYB003]|uniref:hypothetical protein n=1 Tax=Paenibacillus sp. GYB003 TaxID=2994392 RepID=UPI002F963F88